MAIALSGVGRDLRVWIKDGDMKDEQSQIYDPFEV